MALWNPFNLFRRKDKSPQEPATEDSAADSAGEAGSVDPVTEQEVESSTGLDLGVNETEAVDIPQVGAETQGAASETPAAEPTGSLASSPGISDRSIVVQDDEPPVPMEELEVTAADQAAQVPSEPIVESTLELPAVTAASQAVSPKDETVSTQAKATHVPFVEQARPAQPVDLAAKISRKPTTAKVSAESTAEESTRGLVGWFKSAIRKTAQVLNTDIRDLVGRDGRLVDDDFLKELFAHLIKTDMGVAAASEIRDSIHSKYRGRKVQLSELIAAAKTTIREIMKQEEVRLTLADSGTSVVMVVGVNGSGKTTSIAKLANLFREDGKSVVLGAGDTFRAAAVEQLRQWAGRIGAEIVTGEDKADPASVAYRAVKQAVDQKADICIVDTAGRLQTQSHLMQELAKIRRVIDKVVPGAPHETLLVLDSTAGQNAISQARGFSDAAGCSGIVLAKLDGTAKGGVAIPIRKEFGLPVKFIGFGETADAIAPFDVDRYVDALFNID